MVWNGIISRYRINISTKISGCNSYVWVDNGIDKLLMFVDPTIPARVLNI
jgi:hypothetical protein